MNKLKARVIAYYLPQYHPIPENNRWWGNGFTEWINVVKAKPLFKGHYQPHIPSDLGFYDLRLPEVREEQAKMAREAGIEGFCYWRYWFGGKQLLEKPFKEVLESGKPNFPFCLGWANETWSNKSWHSKSALLKDKVLIEQTYSTKDYIEHFYDVLPALKDERYIRVDGKPLFIIFNPKGIPDAQEFLNIWRDLSVKEGLSGIFFVGIVSNISYEDNRKRVPKTNEVARLYNRILDMGFDGINTRGYARAEILLSGKLRKLIQLVLFKLLRITYVRKFKQKDIIEKVYTEEDRWVNSYPTILPNWDRTPRSGKKSVIYTDSTPEVFKQNIEYALDILKNRDDEHKLVFLQSWNEWGEGNYVEPDQKFGRGYLDVLAESIIEKLD